MIGFKTNLETDTVNNTKFRAVIYTGKHSQLVLMCLLPGEDIGMEVHKDNDQFFRFEEGRGTCLIDGNTYEVTAGDAVIIPAGATHNIINSSKSESLKMYTVYSPAHHKDGITRKTKAEATKDAPEFDGVTTE